MCDRLANGGCSEWAEESIVAICVDLKVGGVDCRWNWKRICERESMPLRQLDYASRRQLLFLAELDVCGTSFSCSNSELNLGLYLLRRHIFCKQQLNQSIVFYLFTGTMLNLSAAIFIWLAVIIAPLRSQVNIYLFILIFLQHLLSLYYFVQIILRAPRCALAAL